jgi:hypothetical protein
MQILGAILFNLDRTSITVTVDPLPALVAFFPSPLGFFLLSTASLPPFPAPAFLSALFSLALSVVSLG